MKTGGLSVLVPVFNEAALLEDTLLRVHRHLETLRACGTHVELIAVDDGSIDATPAILAAFAGRHPGCLTIRTHARNQGLKAALRTGCLAVQTPYTIVLDSDLSYAPETIAALMRALEASGASLVLASPYAAGGRVSEVPPLRRAASWGANWLLSMCVGGRIKTFTAMVRAYETVLLQRAVTAESRGEFNAWVVAEALREGASVVEVPAHLSWPSSRRLEVSRFSATKLLSRAAGVMVVAYQLLLRSRPAAVAQRRRHA